MGYDDEMQDGSMQDGSMQDGSMDVLMDGSGEHISIGRPLAVNLMIARLKVDESVESMMVEPNFRCSFN